MERSLPGNKQHPKHLSTDLLRVLQNPFLFGLDDDGLGDGVGDGVGIAIVNAASCS